MRFSEKADAAVWSTALVGIGAWVWTESRPDHAIPSGTNVEAIGDVAAGRDIEGSTITITGPNSDRAPSHAKQEN